MTSRQKYVQKQASKALKRVNDKIMKRINNEVYRDILDVIWFDMAIDPNKYPHLGVHTKDVTFVSPFNYSE